MEAAHIVKVDLIGYAAMEPEDVRPVLEEVRKSLSHDARNILHVAMGYAHLINMETDDDSDGDIEKVRAYADAVIQALERIDNLCVELSDYLEEKQ